MQKTALYVAKKKCIKFLETPHGTGLSHSVAHLPPTQQYIRIIHVDCIDKRSVRNVFVTILHDVSTVRFSKPNYLSIAIDHLLLVVKQRMTTDLKNQTVLLVIDHIDVLNKINLQYLTRLFKFKKSPCGILLRTTTAHRLVLAKTEPALHDELYINLTKETPDMVAMTTRDERKIFIRDVCDVVNEGFINDLSKNNWGYEKMLTFIGRLKEKGGK